MKNVMTVLGRTIVGASLAFAIMDQSFAYQDGTDCVSTQIINCTSGPAPNNVIGNQHMGCVDQNSYIICGWSATCGSSSAGGAGLACAWTGDAAEPKAKHSPANGGPAACGSGSIINFDDRTLIEQVDVVGTPFKLVYSSDRVTGRTADYEIESSVAAAFLGTLTSADVSVALPSGTTNTTYPSPAPGTADTQVWNGKNSGGTYLPASAAVDVTVSTTHTGGHDWPLNVTVIIGNVNAKYVYGLGGWGLDVLHFYDNVRKRVYQGDGSSRRVKGQLDSGHWIVASEEGTEVWVFDNSTGRILEIKTARTGATKYLFSYNGSGHLTSITDAYSNVTTITRDGSGNFTGIQGPYGQTTTVSLDGDGYIASVTNPNSEVYQMTYISTFPIMGGGLLHTFEKPGGQISTFTYTDGLLDTDSSSAGNSTSIVDTLQSNLADQIVATSAEGRATTYNVLNTGGESTTRTEAYPNGFYSSMALTPDVSRTGSNTYFSTLTENYTDDPRLTDRYTYPSSGETAISGVGSRTWGNVRTSSLNSADPFDVDYILDTYTVNGAGTGWTNRFDGTPKTVTTTSPEGRVIVETLDSNERRSSYQVGGLTSVDYTYDGNGRISHIEQGVNRTLDFAYDGSGRLYTVTNAASEVTTYAYDSADRVTSVTLPDSRVIAYGYDSNGNVTSVTPPGKSAHVFVKNDFDLDSDYHPPNLPGPTTTYTTYTYNNDRQLTQISRPSGATITYGFSSVDTNPNSITTPQGSYPMSFSGELLSQITSPDGIRDDLTYHGTMLAYDGVYDTVGSANVGSVAVSRNTKFLLASQTVTDSASATSSISYGYDNDDLLTTVGDETITRSPSTNHITDTALDSLSRSLGYNTFGEMTSDVTTYGATTLYSLTITRDDLGRVDHKTEVVGGTTTVYVYTYDSAGRLTDVTKNGSAYSHYGYDSNSNRTSGTINSVSQSGTYDAQDRVTAYNSNTYTYNLNGERTSKTDGSSNVTSYGYDAWGNLTSVTLPSTTVISYTLDGLQRRVAKSVGGALQTRYLYFGNQLVAELDNSGALQKHYIYGSKANVPDYVDIGGTKYLIVSDQVGSVRRVINSSNGTVAQQINYDEFGRVLSDSNPGFQAFGFAGGMYDPDTSLVHFGAREYDSETGRWMSKDPILFSGGDTNLYGYVLQDPINFVDPSGLTINFGDSLSRAIFNSLMNNPALSSQQRLMIEALERSDKVFDVGQASNASRPAGYIYGQTVPYTDRSGAAIDLWLGNTSNYSQGVLLHELTHAAQFLNNPTANLGSRANEAAAHRGSDSFWGACK